MIDQPNPDRPELYIDIAIDEPLWDGTVKGINLVLEKTLRAAFVSGWPHIQSNAVEKNCEPSMAEVSLVLTDDQAIRRLNASYRQQAKATNVLAFAALDDGDVLRMAQGAPIILGDIVIAYGVTNSEAKNKKISVSSHLCHLVVHGMLHLLGYDHLNDDDAQVMEKMETLVLKQLGINDPYAVPAKGAVIKGDI